MATNNKQLKRGRGRPCIYPWPRWLVKGRRTSILKGKDFDCETRTIELLARRQSKKRNLRSVVRVRGPMVIIEVE